jgi:5-methylcytosine-specific restriction endonuclease McrA
VIAADGLKRCSNQHCSQVNPQSVSAFSNNKGTKDGLRAYCKVCKSIQAAAYRKSNPEKCRTACATWQKANPEKVRSSQASWRKDNPDKVRGHGATYYKNNRDKLRSLHAAYLRTNHDKVCAKAAARRKDSPETFRTKNNMYYAINRDKCRARVAEYQKANREKVRGRAAAYRKVNYQIISARRAAHHKSSPEKARKSAKEWRQANPTKARAGGQRHRARKRSLPVQWTVQDWQSCLEFFDHSCAYCERSNVNLQQEHFIPLDDSKLPDDLRDLKIGTVPWNMFPACGTCNSSKGNKDPFEWVPAGPFWVHALGRITKTNRRIRYEYNTDTRPE